MYEAMHGSAPVYLSELYEQPYIEGRTRLSARGGSADENKVQWTRICRRGSGGMEPVTLLHQQLFIREQFQDGSENISVCIWYLTVLYIFIAACSISLVLVYGLYGALESVTVLRHRINCRDIIIIILWLVITLKTKHDLSSVWSKTKLSPTA